MQYGAESMATIEQRGNSWRASWRRGGRGGQKESTTWPSRKRAEQAAALAAAYGHRITAAGVYAEILGVPAEEPASSGCPTLREWCEHWLPSKTRITSGTRGDYARKLAHRIYPALGDIPIDQLTPTHIGRFLNGLRAEGRRNMTLTNYFNVLHSALAAAVVEGLIPSNPCANSDFVRGQVAEDDTGAEPRVYLTPAQYRLLLAAFTPADRPLVEFLAGTGARWSEATAVRVEDLLPPSKKAGPRVQIFRAWKRDDKNRPYLGTTKGRRKRTVQISHELYELLLELAAGRSRQSLLFIATRGGPVLYHNFYRRRWVPAVVRAQRCVDHPPFGQAQPQPDAAGRCGEFGGVRSNGRPCQAAVQAGTTRCRSHAGPAANAVSPCDCDHVLHVQPTPHDLRHTHAAWLFADPTVAPIAISRRLGHANLSTTSEIYGGLQPSAEDAAVAAISAATARAAA